MMNFKRKKNSRERGTKYHGWGRGQGHHKGAGNKGGRGNAGSGKRADCKKGKYDKLYAGTYFGRRGFYSITGNDFKAIGLQTLDMMLDKLVAEKKVEKKGAIYTVDLTSLGFDKLLGNGKVTHKIEVKATIASVRAIEKIVATGGKVETVIPVGAKASEKEASEEE
jgi:large subunit ribosomal protein L15